jgi:hypothetical protein
MSNVFTDPTEVAEELTRRVSLIRLDDGYQTDIGRADHVFRGRVHFDDDMVPCSSIIEGNDDVQPWPSARVVHAHVKQQYAVVAYVPCDIANPNDAAHKAIKDIKRAIFKTDGKPDSTWGGLVRRVTYRGRNIGPRPAGAVSHRTANCKC